MPNRPVPNGPVLLFDSGVGGLSVLAEVTAVLGPAPIVYAADNAGFPYGEKSEAEIAARVPALLGRLVERYDPAIVVIACNTACTIALGPVRAALDVPVVGTVPAIKPAAALSVSRVIGVLGTSATVRQPYVDRLSADFAHDCLVLRHGSPRLVELAEAKLRRRPVDVAEVVAELAGLTGQPGGERMDVVVLACTHFPLLGDELRRAAHAGAADAGSAPAALAFIDGGAGIARRTAALLADAGWRPAARGEASGRTVFTRASPDIEALRPALADYGLSEIDIL